MLFYSQSLGEWFDDSRKVIISGDYAGGDGGKVPVAVNNSAYQDVPNVGPLPQGQYTIGPLHTLPELGPAMSLTPARSNRMFGRYGFFYHMDNPIHVGILSDGCIVAKNTPEMSGYQKQELLESLRSGGQDQVIVTA